MEEYSDLKFDGDLSFLNENLDAAKNEVKAKVEEQAKQEPVATNYNTGTPTPQNTEEKMEKFNETVNNQNTSSSNSNENQVNNRMDSVMINQNAPQFGEKKSQLEAMVLSSGYGPEMFDKLKMELLEMEKEKIIMKYKQDLMMMIIKS